jgi:hypothetical protein
MNNMQTMADAAIYCNKITMRAKKMNSMMASELTLTDKDAWLQQINNSLESMEHDILKLKEIAQEIHDNSGTAIYKQ